MRETVPFSRGIIYGGLQIGLVLIFINAYDEGMVISKINIGVFIRFAFTSIILDECNAWYDVEIIGGSTRVALGSYLKQSRLEAWDE